MYHWWRFNKCFAIRCLVELKKNMKETAKVEHASKCWNKRCRKQAPNSRNRRKKIIEQVQLFFGKDDNTNKTFSNLGVTMDTKLFNRLEPLLRSLELKHS